MSVSTLSIKNQSFANPNPETAMAAFSGVSLELFYSLTELYSLVDPKISLKIIPKATLARRKHSETLNAPESETVFRLMRIWQNAISALGSEEIAIRFLGKPHPLLGGKSPVEMALLGETGGVVVDNLLGQIEAGVAA